MLFKIPDKLKVAFRDAAAEKVREIIGNMPPGEAIEWLDGLIARLHDLREALVGVKPPVITVKRGGKR